MARSAKVSPAVQDELELHGQLSLFQTKRADEGTTTREVTSPRSELKPVAKAKKQSHYSAADIQVLQGIEAIRHRPGMYIGSTSTSGLLHLIWEALDNAVDEAVAGFGKNIWLRIDADGWISVRDEARGMPFDPMLYQDNYLPAATVILTVPHSGGKFAEGVYKTAGGLHGVGATIINALSEHLELTIWKDGKQFTQTFNRGEAAHHHITSCDPKLHGTQLRWLYDRSVF